MEEQFVSEGKVYAAGMLFDGHYRLIRQLNDRRATVTVWLARDINTVDREASANDESSGKLVRLVICHPDIALDLEEEQRWQDEFDAAYDCQHPNLLPPEEYTIVNDVYCLVFPYTETDSLRQFIGKNMPEKMARKLISDLASGLDELHSHQPRIIHGDLKPSNILVINDEDFVISNYGIHFESDHQRIENRSFSLAYMAPERFQDNAVASPESDVWALGATLYEVLTGRKPFGVEGGKNQRDDTPMPPLPNQPDEIRNLVYACLQADPKKRPTAQQINESIRSKKISKPKKKSQPRPAKKRPVVIVIVALLLIAVSVYFLKPLLKAPVSKVTGKDPSEVVAIVKDYKYAEKLLQNASTAEEGKKLLESLAENDGQAAFLLSRLYFDTRGTDTVFYNKDWEQMRKNCGITPNNKIAHEYLFKAFELKEDDFMILYQLGRDFKSGEKRGCERKPECALWCFNAAEEQLDSSDSNYNLYGEELKKRIEGIDKNPEKPMKP